VNSYKTALTSQLLSCELKKSTIRTGAGRVRTELDYLHNGSHDGWKQSLQLPLCECWC
jgi:hypothetical protein